MTRSFHEHYSFVILLLLSLGSASAAGPPELLQSLFQPPAAFRDDFGDYPSPLKFYSGRAVIQRAEWSARRAEIRQEWEKLMGPWPPLLASPRWEVLQSHHRAGEPFLEQRIRLEIARGQTNEGYLLLPTNAPPWPAVVVPFYEPETSIGRGKPFLDFGYQLARRGFVTLSIGSPGGSASEPEVGNANCQPLSFLGYVAANCLTLLARMPGVQSNRIGIVGHSYGGKWAMFASCLDDRFACAVWSDPGIVFDETRPNVNYWEPWYLGADRGVARKPGVPTAENPRTGSYRELVSRKRDLNELHALMAPRPFLVSGGSEDQPERWRALNHAVAVNHFLGFSNRVAMSNRPTHTPTAESNEQIYRFLEYFLKEDGLKTP